MIDQEEEPHCFTEPIDGVFTDLGTATMEPPAWVLVNSIPVGLTFIGAPPKCGKSTFVMALAAKIAGLDNKTLPADITHLERGGSVMGFSAEASAGELRHMLEHEMLTPVPDDGSILIADDPFAWRLDDPDGQWRLAKWLDERKPRALIIDPLRDFHDFDEKESGEMNRLLRPIQKWAKQTESAAIVVHHTTKPKEGQVEYDPMTLRGSSALFGLADCVLMLSPGPEGFLKLKATFKRAQPYERTFRMAAYAYKGMPVVEGLQGIDTEVYKGVKNSLGVDDIRKQLHVSAARVQESLNRLLSNSMIRKEGRIWLAVTDTQDK